MLKKETQSGMPSAGLARTPYKTKNVYVPKDTHRLQTPPPQRTSVSLARGACGCVRVCVRIARARPNYTRGRARARRTRALRARTVPAHRTRALYALYANRTRGLYAKSVRQILLCFFNLCCLLLKICCGFSTCAVTFLHVRSTRVVAVRYGARARAYGVYAGARARKLYAWSARALYARTVRAHCTYRTQTVRPDCTQKVCAKICCVLFKICCVFSISVVFFSKSAVFFCTYGPRVRWPYGSARARAMCVRATRACTVRARCTYRMHEPFSRTVRKKRVPNSAVFFSKSDVFFFAKSVASFFNSAVFFSHVRSAHTVVVRYGTRAYGPHACTVYSARARCTCRVCGARETHVRCAASAFSC